MKKFVTSSLVLTTIAIYLFVSAPAQLPDGIRGSQKSISIEKALKILATQQDEARALYTAEIVSAGSKAGLKFGEQWKRDEVEEGPLPALLLREVASNIRKTEVPLGLFLGSDYPISPSNMFNSDQMGSYLKVKESGSPIFFSTGNQGATTAMFPDFASAQGCVTCHNEHPTSPKLDWKLQDIMGATTWTYPKSSVSPDELAEMLQALRSSVREAYSTYIEKTSRFKNPPSIGNKWPRDGYSLPTPDEFIAELDRRSGSILNSLLESLTSKHEGNRS